MKLNRNGKASALTDAQLTALLDAAPSPKYRCLWALQYYCAARVSEALSLTWDCVSNGRITFKSATTKTKTTRQPVTHPRLQEELDRYRASWGTPEGHECLFHTQDSTTQPMSRQAADKALRAVCGALGIEGASTHSFRRSAAMKAVASGVDPYRARALTGHKSIASLSEYIDIQEEDLLACQAVL